MMMKKEIEMVDVQSVVAESRVVAREAAEKFFQERLGGVDQYACGFAWVKVFEKGSTKLGKALIAAGFDKSYTGGLQMWNPSGNWTQCITAKEVGAEAAAKVLTEKLGVKAYAGSRMD